MTIKPRKYQEQAIYSIFDYFYQGKEGNPLVVAPTGSGKSIMISYFCEQVNKRWPGQKILIISHVKEILQQDYNTIKDHTNLPIGLYSSGLNSKTIKNITVAGIQSIYNKPELFDQFNIIIIDEAHTIPINKNSMYRKFFAQVTVPIIGFTASPYRLGTGYLHIGKDAFFDDIIYNIPIKLLQDKGYLCKLTTKGTKKKLDTIKIKKTSSTCDYIITELSKAFDRKRITKEIVQELLIYKDLRKKWLLFAIDIKHAEHVTRELNKNNISTGCVHSKKKNRDKVIQRFKNNEYQALVSVAVLTTGFDAPDVDLIGLIRPTASPVLHVQIIGRGLRPSPETGKENCLILDFAGNLLRNGPIDAPIIKIQGNGSGEPIMKECDHCYEIVHAAIKECPVCKTPFKFKHKLISNPSEREILAIQDWHDIDDIKYFRYVGSRKIPMLKVSYFCGLRRFNEYVCVEHGGYAKHQAHFWLGNRLNYKMDTFLTAQQALEISDKLKKPVKILVKEKGKYPEIMDYQWRE